MHLTNISIQALDWLNTDVLQCIKDKSNRFKVFLKNCVADICTKGIQHEEFGRVWKLYHIPDQGSTIFSPYIDAYGFTVDVLMNYGWWKIYQEQLFQLMQNIKKFY